MLAFFWTVPKPAVALVQFSELSGVVTTLAANVVAETGVEFGESPALLVARTR